MRSYSEVCIFDKQIRDLHFWPWDAWTEDATSLSHDFGLCNSWKRRKISSDCFFVRSTYDTCKLPQVCDCHIHPPEYKRSFTLSSELLLLGLQSSMCIFVA